MNRRTTGTKTAAAYMRRLAVLVVLAGGAIFGSPLAQAESGAVRGIEGFHATLLEVMQDAEALGYDGRRERLAPVIKKIFDLPYISQVVLGRSQWSSLTEAQQASMVETFSNYTISTYADRFDGYSGEFFETVSERDLSRGRVLVRTILRKSDGDVVELDYILHKEDDAWRIVNVIHNGISDLSLKRADYGSVIRRDGFEALIARLDEQIAEQASGAER